MSCVASKRSICVVQISVEQFTITLNANTQEIITLKIL